jgi:hypothetical protein
VLFKKTILVEDCFRNGGKYTTAAQQLFTERFLQSVKTYRHSTGELIKKFRDM